MAVGRESFFLGPATDCEHGYCQDHPIGTQRIMSPDQAYLTDLDPKATSLNPTFEALGM